MHTLVKNLIAYFKYFEIQRHKQLIQQTVQSVTSSYGFIACVHPSQTRWLLCIRHFYRHLRSIHDFIECIRTGSVFSVMAKFIPEKKNATLLLGTPSPKANLSLSKVNMNTFKVTGIF